MSQPDSFDVILVDFPPNLQQETPAEALERVFGVDAATATRIVSSVPVVVKYDAPAPVARQYAKALTQAGAKVTFSPSARPTPTPTPVPPPASPPPYKLADVPGFEENSSPPPHQRRRPPPPSGPSASASTVEPKDKPSFLRGVAGSFLYPFKGMGWLMILVGGLVFAGGAFISSISFLGFVGTFIIFGYWAAYMFKVASHSSDGEEYPPQWPDFSSFWDDILSPAFRLYGIFVIAFGPAVAAFLFFFSSSGVTTTTTSISVSLAVLGAIYVPMAILCVALRGTIGGANPILVIRAIFVSWKEYLLALVLLLPIFFVGSMAGELSGFWIVPGTIVSLWLMMTEMRILGLIYYTNADRLEWL